MHVIIGDYQCFMLQWWSQSDHGWECFVRLWLSYHAPDKIWNTADNCCRLCRLCTTWNNVSTETVKHVWSNLIPITLHIVKLHPGHEMSHVGGETPHIWDSFSSSHLYFWSLNTLFKLQHWISCPQLMKQVSHTEYWY